MTKTKLLFDRDKLEPGLILAGRNPAGKYPAAIRATLGCYTNHNGLFILDRDQWFVGEAVQPFSRLTTLCEYEQLINRDGYIVRVWRVVSADSDSREFAAHYFRTHLLGLEYADHSIAKLAVFRFVNNIPWTLHIRGVFCTGLVAAAWGETPFDPYVKPWNRKPKKNATPRTGENRLTAGVLEDVTETVLVPA